LNPYYICRSIANINGVITDIWKMNESQLKSFEKMLKIQLTQLETVDSLGQDGQKTVTLDQQSVGRLSRMDALQQQAMSKATQERRQVTRQRILAALQRVKDDEFGYCMNCGEDIPERRLDIDPTAVSCVFCINN
jgi:DnaK suppressor protein